MDNEVEVRVKATNNTGRGFASVRASARTMLRGLSRDAEKEGGNVSKRLAVGLARGLTAARRAVAAAAKPVATAAAAAFVVPFLAQVAAGLAAGSVNLFYALGAGLALLPAVALAAASAVGAVAIAVRGVGDAVKAGLTGDLEAYKAALDGLSPSARKVVGEAVAMKDGLTDLKATVQENFFAPLVGAIQPLAEAYLPLVTDHLARIARAFGKAAEEAAEFLATPSVVWSLGVALGHVAEAVEDVADGLPTVLERFLPFITVGSRYLPVLTQHVHDMSSSFGDFLNGVEGAGQLDRFIQRGIQGLLQLNHSALQIQLIFGHLRTIGGRVWSAFGLQTGALLPVIEDLTSRVVDFLDTKEGAKGLATVVGIISAVFGQLRDTVVRVATMLANVFGPILPQIGAFAFALLQLKAAIIDTALDALEPVLMGIADVLGAYVLPALTALATWLAENQPVLQGIGIAIMTLLIPAFAAWAISAGIAAINTLLLFAPLILLGAAIAALAALVIIHFDTIKRWISNVFTWVKDNWPLLLAILTGPFGLAALFIANHWETIKSGARAVLDFVTTIFASLVAFVMGLPEGIRSAASGMWDGITDAFRDAINAIIRGWNSLELSFPGFDPPGPGSFGGFTVGTPDIPQLAHGGIRGGMVSVGEAGRELLELPQGSRVYPHRTSEAMANGSASPGPDTAGGGGFHVHLHVAGNILAERDVVRIVRDAAQGGALRGVFP